MPYAIQLADILQDDSNIVVSMFEWNKCGPASGVQERRWHWSCAMDLLQEQQKINVVSKESRPSHKRTWYNHGNIIVTEGTNMVVGSNRHPCSGRYFAQITSLAENVVVRSSVCTWHLWKVLIACVANQKNQGSPQKKRWHKSMRADTEWCVKTSKRTFGICGCSSIHWLNHGTVSANEI